VVNGHNSAAEDQFTRWWDWYRDIGKTCLGRGMLTVPVLLVFLYYVHIFTQRFMFQCCVNVLLGQLLVLVPCWPA